MYGCPSAAPALLTSSSFKACVLEHHSIFLLSPGLPSTFTGMQCPGVPWPLTTVVQACHSSSGSAYYSYSQGHQSLKLALILNPRGPRGDAVMKDVHEDLSLPS